LRSSGARISRETAVQDSHALDGICFTISASVLRALMRRGSLQARSVNLRNVDLRELRAFRTILLMKPPCRGTRRRARFSQVFIPAIPWLMVEVGDGEPYPNDRRLGHAI
jgi:hypothetical protein